MNDDENVNMTISAAAVAASRTRLIFSTAMNVVVYFREK